MEYPIEKTLGLRKQPPRGLDKEGLGSWGGLFGGRQQYDAEGNPITHKVPPEGEPYFGRYWEPDPAGGWFSEGDPEQVAEEERGRRIAEERTRRQNELTMHGPYGDPSKEGTPSYAKDVLGQNWEQHTGADRRAPIRFDPRVERGAQLENLKQSLLGGVRAPASSADADTPWAGFDYTPHVPREELFSGVEPQPTGPVQPRGFHNLGPADQEYLRGWWNAPRLGGSSILQDQPLDPNPMYFDPNKPNPLSR